MDAIKRTVKVGASSALFLVDLLRGGRMAWSSRGVILLYHDVHEHHRSRFSRQLRAMRRCGTVVRLDDIEAVPDGRWRVAITFDDGRRTFLETALDELLAEHAPAALFVPPALLGDTIPDEDAPLMTASELRALPQLIDIGSHGLTHVRESKLTTEDLKDELVQSQHTLEALVGRPVERHAYPYGDCSGAVVEMAGEVYRSCYTVTPNLAPPRSSGTTGRVETDPADWPIEFWLKIHGAYRWMGWYIDAKQRTTAAASSFLRAARGRPDLTAKVSGSV